VLIPPQYTLNQNITTLLKDIEHLKTKFDLTPQEKTVEKFSRKKSILKSAVYSARIEGNPKTLEEVSVKSIKNSDDKHQLELSNLYKALEFILSEPWENELTAEDLKNIHALVLSGLSSQAGSLRQEPSAIFNEAGAAIYVCPPPQEIGKLLKSCLLYVNKENEPFIPIKAALSHYSFEKIHPFLDGNGRVGRILVHLIFKKWNYDLRGFVDFEEYLDNNRSTYYDLLNLNRKDITKFIEFFLETLSVSFAKAIQERSKTKPRNKEEILPARRFEILHVIRDHRQVSFNFIKRRFMAVSDRLLRYDLKSLQDKGFIIKRGVTKGAVYEPKI
jgi:Fic family protein